MNVNCGSGIIVCSLLYILLVGASCTSRQAALEPNVLDGSSSDGVALELLPADEIDYYNSIMVDLDNGVFPWVLWENESLKYRSALITAMCFRSEVYTKYLKIYIRQPAPPDHSARLSAISEGIGAEIFTTFDDPKWFEYILYLDHSYELNDFIKLSRTLLVENDELIYMVSPEPISYPVLGN